MQISSIKNYTNLNISKTSNDINNKNLTFKHKLFYGAIDEFASELIRPNTSISSIECKLRSIMESLIWRWEGCNRVTNINIPSVLKTNINCLLIQPLTIFMKNINNGCSNGVLASTKEQIPLLIKEKNSFILKGDTKKNSYIKIEQPSDNIINLTTNNGKFIQKVDLVYKMSDFAYFKLPVGSHISSIMRQTDISNPKTRSIRYFDNMGKEIHF